MAKIIKRKVQLGTIPVKKGTKGTKVCPTCGGSGKVSK